MSYWDEEAEQEFKAWFGEQMLERREIKGLGNDCGNYDPCPFCGHTMALLDYSEIRNGGYFVRCENCFACGPQTRWHRHAKKEAHVKWSSWRNGKVGYPEGDTNKSSIGSLTKIFKKKGIL